MLEVRTVSKTFNPGTPNELRALQSVSVKVEDGSFIVIIGTNGSGKSTLLNAVAGSFRIDSGLISVAGEEITSWPEHRRAKLIGRVFQNPFSGTAANMSVAENLALAAFRGRPRRLGWSLGRNLLEALRDRIAELNMGLEDRLKNPIGSLSGGQRQALTLLMATWLRPNVLLLDEHTAALDPAAAELVMRLTDSVVRQFDITTVMVTHSMRQALDFGSRIIMLHQGSIILDISGAERASVTLDDLLELFRRKEGKELADDQLLLA